MFDSTATATAALHTATAAASSPPRPSRLRGLSYLLSYTHNHLNRADIPPPPVPPPVPSTSNPALPSNDRATPPPHLPSDSQRGNRQPAVWSTIQAAENGWIPTIQGRSGLLRDSPHQTSTSTESASPEPRTTVADMTRSRTANTQGPSAMANTTARRASVTEATTEAGESSSAMPDSAALPAGQTKDQLPTIRFIPHVETRANHRPSLQFAAVSRQLKAANSVVRVGRYSERDHAAGEVVGFKSKVVSRRHCEFWCNEGQWYVKDVKSSSGTFLNHVRLSCPGAESRPYPVNDGDVVQLGIDFKGGEEAIFRCVKIRIECNRGWQKALNNFNTSAHKKLFKNALKTKARDSDAASVNSSDCSICLNPVAPCQALFVAPCSHVWHFKCVRNYINGPAWPNFNCPNCRLVSDLDADVDVEPMMDGEFDDPIEEHAELEESSQEQADGRVESRVSSEENMSYSNSDGDDPQQYQRYHTPPPPERDGRVTDVEEELSRLLHESTVSLRHALPLRQAEAGAAAVPAHGSLASPVALGTRPIDIAPLKSGSRPPNEPHGPRSTTPTILAQFALSPRGPVHDGPLTPRNDAGPFIFDDRGRADRSLVGQAAADVDASSRRARNSADSETF